SPASTAVANFLVKVFRRERTALLRSWRASFWRLRLIWDLMLAMAWGSSRSNGSAWARARWFALARTGEEGLERAGAAKTTTGAGLAGKVPASPRFRQPPRSPRATPARGGDSGAPR